jgi:hypothetical protein
MRSFKHSIAVNIPVNGMSGVTRHGEAHPYTLEELNNKYLAEQVIDLDFIMQNQIFGCHQEVPFKFCPMKGLRPPTNLKVKIKTKGKHES